MSRLRSARDEKTYGLILTVLLAAACGSRGKPLPDGGSGGTVAAVGWMSGARLRAVVNTVGSARKLVRWHDRQLDVDCDFGVASDGKTRCLPAIAFDVSTLFADSQCQTAAGVHPAGSPAPKYLPPPSAPFVCGKGGDYYGVGAAFTAPAIYQRSGDGTCIAAPVAPGSEYLRATGVIAPTAFVAAVEHLDPRSSRLSVRQLVGDDGTVQDVDAADGARNGARCAANMYSPTETYCTPIDLAYVERFFSDAACSVPAAFHPGYAQQTCARAPTAIQGTMFYEVGARLGASIYDGAGAQCMVYVPDASLSATFYALGAPLPVSSLPSLSVANEGSGRVLLQVARSESKRIQTLDFFDTAKSVACFATPAADGRLRCLPSTSLSINAFGDARCTQGLVIVGSGSPAPAAGSFAITSSGLAAGNAVFQVGAKVATPAMVWQWNGPTCSPTAAQPNSDYYAAAPVDPTELAAVETVVE